MKEQELRKQLELDLIYWGEVDKNEKHPNIQGRAEYILTLIKEAGGK